MAEISLPDMSLQWAQAGDILQPPNSKILSGWSYEIPPRQWFNWLDNRQDRAIAHIVQHGVSTWSPSIEYTAAKSYVQGSDGEIYRSVASSGPSAIVQDPVTDVSGTYWTILVPQASETEAGTLRIGTQAEVDAGARDDVAVTPAKLKKHSSIGVGQTWQDFTGSRTWATTYTNTTGRPIQISINVRDPGAGNLGAHLFVGGAKIGNFYLSGSSQATLTAIVPPGATYQLTRDDTNDTILLWVELR